MNQLRVPDKGAVVKLGPPVSGEVIITVDPIVDGTTFAAGTQTFLPGAMVHVPRGAWYGVRNTGTGEFQVAWTSSPPGLEAFFRELSSVGAAPSEPALQELAQRHQMEFRPAGATPISADRPRSPRGGRRHRSGRGHARPAEAASPGAPSSTPPPVSTEPSAASTATPPTTPAAARAASGAPHGHRRRRRGGRGGGGGRATPSSTPQPPREEPSGAPSTTPSAPVSPARPATSRSSSGPRRRSRRFKEVYMGGRWVRVSDEGPVIAPGPQESGRRGQKPGEDDEPHPRLTVPL